MRTETGTALALLLALSAGQAVAQEPLSAIDWLSDSVATPVALPAPDMVAQPEPAPDMLPEVITTTSIDGPTWDAAGLLPTSVTGLPRDLWGQTPTEDLARMIRAERVDTLPAIQDLLYTLLQAELDPPADAAGRGRMFLARIDKLLDLGAIEPAMALLEQAGPTAPELFRRIFDVALLLGEEDRACETMRAHPEIAPTFPARIFCLARGGDWNAAALTLRTGEALGYVTEDEADLMARFLDPELFEGEPPLPQPARPTPLIWRMFEAIGEPMPTAALPVAFAHGDLRSNTGWKAQLEAAERLTRMGALPPNRLLGLYTDGAPSASGGVWDRVRAMQRLESALEAGDTDAIAVATGQAWTSMATAELEMVLAELHGPRLAELSLPGEAAGIAFRLGLLSGEYESVAAAHDPADSTEALLRGIAIGDVTGATPVDRTAAALAAAFSATSPPPGAEALIEDRRLGEAILIAADDVRQGVLGDVMALERGLATLRMVGFEDIARRAALQILLLDRRG